MKKAVPAGAKVSRKVLCNSISPMFRGWNVIFEDVETKAAYSFQMDQEPDYKVGASYELAIL